MILLDYVLVPGLLCLIASVAIGDRYRRVVPTVNRRVVYSRAYPHRFTSLVNFGAMTAFLVLHVTVVVHYVVRHGSRRWWAHLAAPVIGFVILGYVVFNAKVAAQTLGFVWLGVGVVVLIVLLLTGRRPRLAGVTGDAAEPDPPPASSHAS